MSDIKENENNNVLNNLDNVGPTQSFNSKDLEELRKMMNKLGLTSNCDSVDIIEYKGIESIGCKFNSQLDSNFDFDLGLDQDSNVNLETDAETDDNTKLKKIESDSKVSLASCNNHIMCYVSTINDNWHFEDYDERFVSLVKGDCEESISISVIPVDWMTEFITTGNYVADEEHYLAEKVMKRDAVNTPYGEAQILEKRSVTIEEEEEYVVYGVVIWNGKYNSPNFCVSKSALESIGMPIIGLIKSIFS